MTVVRLSAGSEWLTHPASQPASRDRQTAETASQPAGWVGGGWAE